MNSQGAKVRRRRGGDFPRHFASFLLLTLAPWVFKIRQNSI